MNVDSSSPKSTILLRPEDDSSSGDSDVHIIHLEGPKVPEKILRKRITRKVKYLVKWKGCPEVENSWEMEEDIRFPNLVAEFESKLRAKKIVRGEQPAVSIVVPPLDGENGTKTDDNGQGGGASSSKNVPSTTVAIPEKSADSAKTLTGFDRGLQPQEIYGATDSTGELMFLMKWKETDDWELVPARVANVKCPQEVIAFYEGNMKYGYDRGLQPWKILDATNVSGKLFFLMSWKGADKAELVPALQANVKSPQKVIEFYEAQLKFEDSTE